MSERATVPETSARHPKPWRAAVLSIVQPGLGHLYARHWPYGVVFIFISSLYSLPLVVLVVTGQIRQPLLVAFSAIAIGVVATAAVLAYRLASNGAPNSRRWWQRLWALAAIPILSISLVQIPLPIAIDTFRNYSVASNSMWPSLLAGEVFLTTSWPLRWRSPEAGEIIIFHLPEDNRTDYVMRVIAVAGDRIELRQGEVFINGRALTRKSSRAATPPHNGRTVIQLMQESAGQRAYDIAPSGTHDPKFTIAPIVVPAGHVFVLGDNRGNSRDSRYFGPVRVADVTSKAIRIIASPQKGRFWKSLDEIGPTD